jgi:hypothetical protein
MWECIIPNQCKQSQPNPAWKKNEDHSFVQQRMKINGRNPFPVLPYWLGIGEAWLWGSVALILVTVNTVDPEIKIIYRIYKFELCIFCNK